MPARRGEPAPTASCDDRGSFLCRLAGACAPAAAPARLTWKEEFSSPESCWLRCCGGHYATFRVALFLVWTTCIAYSVIQHSRFFGATMISYWLTRLTHWSALLQAAYLGFAAATTVRARAAACDDTVCPWYAAVALALGAIVPVISTMVCMMFWFMVFKPGDPVEFRTVMMHGGNLLVTAVDTLVTRQRYRARYAFAPMLVGLLYVMFTYVYYVSGGEDEEGNKFLYRAIDWSRPGAVGRLSAVLVFFVVPVMHCACSVLVAVRVRCGSRAAEAECGAQAGEAKAPSSSPVDP
mmetsp:Transcript_98728/g.283679  ORF Transcript_98728/g.283679 Transcript_98728/m.283679 type:complete len:294 (-) Transcript_98728:146-1027(-)